MKSAEKVVPLRQSAKRGESEEIAFLPAALEIVETPASPAGRAIAWVIISVFCLALAWAAIGKVDIVASARGQVIPSGRSKVIQPFETGVVRAVHVRDGDKVMAGDVLIELDPTMAEADVGRLTSELESAQLDAARLRAALATSPLDSFKPPQGIRADLVETQRQALLEMVTEHENKLAALDSTERAEEGRTRFDPGKNRPETGNASNASRAGRYPQGLARQGNRLTAPVS